MADNNLPQIISRQTTVLSPWFSLDSVTMRGVDPKAAIETYHGVRQADYVNVLAMTRSGLIPLVRQYRPIIETWTLEFPGGLRESNEQPSVTATRELTEETGLKTLELVPLIDTFADTGRLTNRLFGFFALVEGKLSSEPGLTVELIPGNILRRHALENQLGLPTNIALLYLAGIHEVVRAICAKCGFSIPPWMI
jgi:8-oxo-dGTP pyrophosphatase MutT (NUDIX family)